MDNTRVYLYGQEVVTPYYLNEAVADKATKAYVDEAHRTTTFLTDGFVNFTTTGTARYLPTDIAQSLLNEVNRRGANWIYIISDTNGTNVILNNNEVSSYRILLSSAPFFQWDNFYTYSVLLTQKNGVVEQAYSSSGITSFASKTYVDEAVANAGGEADLTNYYTKEEVEQLISNAVNDASQVFANYYIKEEVEQLIAQAVAEALGTTEAALDEIIEGGE